MPKFNKVHPCQATFPESFVKIVCVCVTMPPLLPSIRRILYFSNSKRLAGMGWEIHITTKSNSFEFNPTHRHSQILPNISSPEYKPPPNISPPNLPLSEYKPMGLLSEVYGNLTKILIPITPAYLSSISYYLEEIFLYISNNTI